MAFEVTTVVRVGGTFDDGAASSLCSLLERILAAGPTASVIVDFAHARSVAFVALAAVAQYGSRAPVPLAFRGLSHQHERFLQYLMSSADRTVAALAVGPRGGARRSPGRGTVLVVDDDVELRAALAEILASEGYTPIEARDGEDALQVLRGGEPAPDMILLDLRMPRMDGRQFRQAQLADRELAKIPVVVLSGDEAAPSCSASLVKPFEPAQLVETVAAVLEKQRAPALERAVDLNAGPEVP